MTPSLSANAIRLLFRALGIKKSYQNPSPPYLKMRRWNYKPAEQGPFTTEPIDGSLIYFYHPTTQTKNRVLVWFPGGAYSLGPLRVHFNYLKKICDETQSIGVLLDYPKAPEYNHEHVFQFLDKLSSIIESKFKNHEISWIGDSAGGGLAIAYALYLQNRSRAGTPKCIFAISPAVDMSLSQNDIEVFEKIDPFLSAIGIRTFGKWYASGTDVKDPRISPLFSTITRFKFKLHIHIGTHDVLYPSALEFYHRFKEFNPDLTFESYPEMIHDWALMPIPEAKQTYEMMIKAII